MKCMKEDPKMMRMMAGQDVSENSDACGACDVAEDACQGPCPGKNSVVPEEPESFEWCIDCVVKHSVEYHLGQLRPEVEDADLKLDICKWCPELEEENPCNCTGNNWEEETEEEELEEIFCGKLCDLTDDDFKSDEDEDLAKCSDCPYPADDPAWDIDPLEDSCPPDEDEESLCEHLASEHRRIVALKKEELKQKIKHAKMAEKIRENILECLPQDDCNSSSNNDAEDREREALKAELGWDISVATHRNIQREIRESLMSCGVLCRKCGKRKENDNCNNESSADWKRRFEQHHHHQHHQRHRQNHVSVGKCARRTFSEDKEQNDEKGNSKSLRRDRSDLCVDIADRIDGTMVVSMAQGVDKEQNDDKSLRRERSDLCV